MRLGGAVDGLPSVRQPAVGDARRRSTPPTGRAVSQLVRPA